MPKLLEQARNCLRVRHYSYQTEKTYIYWIRRYIFFHRLRHPRDLGAAHVTEFLSHLARVKNVSATTQNQALAALLFLYRTVLGEPLPWLDNVERAKKRARVPVVFTREEVRLILLQLHGTKWLMASLLYGAGLRLSECLRLRVKDVDFGYQQIVVRGGKGGQDRFTLLPESLLEAL